MIVDAHVHIFPPRMIRDRADIVGRDPTFREMYSDPAARMATAQDLIAAMDEDEVDVSVAMGIGWGDSDLARESNDYLAEAVDRHPGRIVGFGSVNPASAGAAREIERCAQMGLRGIGELHPDTQGFEPADEVHMKPVVDALQANDMALTMHCSEPLGHEYPGKGRVTPDRSIGLAALAGDVRLILAHWGGGLPFYSLMPEVNRALADVYFDSAASPFLYDGRVFDVVASLIGFERVLAASDFPLMRFGRVRRQLEDSALQPGARAAILGGNAARLFLGEA